MFSSSVKKSLAVLFSTAVMGLGVTGCGGGSSDASAAVPVDTSAIAETEKVVITEANSEEVIGTAFDAIGTGIDTDPTSFKTTNPTKVLPQLKTLETPIFNKTISTMQNFKELAVTEVVQCTDGGSISYNEASETSVSITYDNCQEYGIITDGTINATANSDYTSFQFALTDFSISYDTDTIYYESMTYDYTIDSSTGTIGNITMTLDGYHTFNAERTDFLNYKLQIREGTNNDIFFSINGFVKTSCLNAWIEIQTTQEVNMGYYDYCPTSGQIVIGGNGSEVTVTFNNDGSVDVAGAVTAHYDNCNTLDGTACSL